MNEKRNDTSDIIALILKLLFALATIAAGVVIGIKLYEKIQSKRMSCLCDCCDDDYYDDEDFDDEESSDDTVAEVTEKEIFPTEEE